MVFLSYILFSFSLIYLNCLIFLHCLTFLHYLLNVSKPYSTLTSYNIQCLNIIIYMFVTISLIHSIISHIFYIISYLFYLKYIKVAFYMEENALLKLILTIYNLDRLLLLNSTTHRYLET